MPPLEKIRNDRRKSYQVKHPKPETAKTEQKKKEKWLTRFGRGPSLEKNCVVRRKGRSTAREIKLGPGPPGVDPCLSSTPAPEEKR